MRFRALCLWRSLVWLEVPEGGRGGPLCAPVPRGARLCGWGTGVREGTRSTRAPDSGGGCAFVHCFHGGRSCGWGAEVREVTRLTGATVSGDCAGLRFAFTSSRVPSRPPALRNVRHLGTGGGHAGAVVGAGCADVAQSRYLGVADWVWAFAHPFRGGGSPAPLVNVAQHPSG